jgi:hypothetical protein
VGTTASQIETDIERMRATLGSNIEELEHKVKTATDWRHHYRKNPLPMLGLAFGGGVLLSAMLGGRKKLRTLPPDESTRSHAWSASTQGTGSKAREIADDVKGALIGVAATQVMDYVGQLIPGFREQYQRTRDRRVNS